MIHKAEHWLDEATHSEVNAVHHEAKDEGACKRRFDVLTTRAVGLRSPIFDARLALLERQVDVVGNEDGRDDDLDDVIELEPEQTVEQSPKEATTRTEPLIERVLQTEVLWFRATLD